MNERSWILAAPTRKQESSASRRVGEWTEVEIGELARFSSGSGISIAALHSQSTDFPVPVYGGNGIAGYTSRPNVDGPTVVVGRVGQRCGQVHMTGGPALVTDNALYPTSIRRQFDLGFFGLALSAARLNDVKNRNDLPLVTQTILHAVRLRWPEDIDEQRAIAAALSDVDALIGALDRLIAKKRDLKQAAMQQLLTGQTRLPGFCGRWVATTLGDIGECVIGLTYKPENVVEHGLLVLRSSNVQEWRLAFEDNVYVNVAVSERLLTRENDIVVCVRNGSRALIGKCALIDQAHAGLSFGAFMSVYRSEFAKFVFHSFQSHGMQRQIRDNIGATINQMELARFGGQRILLGSALWRPALEIVGRQIVDGRVTSPAVVEGFDVLEDV